MLRPSQSSNLYSQGMKPWNKWTKSSRKSNRPKYKKGIRLIWNNLGLTQIGILSKSIFNLRSIPNHKHRIDTDFIAKSVNGDKVGRYHSQSRSTGNILSRLTERYFSHSEHSNGRNPKFNEKLFGTSHVKVFRAERFRHACFCHFVWNLPSHQLPNDVVHSTSQIATYNMVIEIVSIYFREMLGWNVSDAIHQSQLFIWWSPSVGLTPPIQNTFFFFGV